MLSAAAREEGGLFGEHGQWLTQEQEDLKAPEERLERWSSCFPSRERPRSGALGQSFWGLCRLCGGV